MKEEYLYVENSLTKSLDETLKQARGKNNMPVHPVPGLPGFGATSTVMAWLEHNNLPFIRIDAGCLRLQKREVEVLDWSNLFNMVEGKEAVVVNKIPEPETVKKTYEYIFDDKQIDLMDNENTVVFIDDYDFAPLAVRKHLMILLRKLVVRDLRCVEDNCQKEIKCLMFIVRAHSPFVSGQDPYTEEEMQYLGVENL